MLPPLSNFLVHLGKFVTLLSCFQEIKYSLLNLLLNISLNITQKVNNYPGRSEVETAGGLGVAVRRPHTTSSMWGLCRRAGARNISSLSRLPSLNARGEGHGRCVTVPPSPLSLTQHRTVVNLSECLPQCGPSGGYDFDSEPPSYGRLDPSLPAGFFPVVLTAQRSVSADSKVCRIRMHVCIDMLVLNFDWSDGTAILCTPHSTHSTSDFCSGSLEPGTVLM